ncbi:MAG: hypothetical protein KDD47_06860 [Acidobacteria bacterium]|nr:hypothetical protein [Acidobacteriota bacterium]
MTAKDQESLLWNLASHPAPAGDSTELTDEILERYRSGALDPEQEKEVELVLAADRRGRERLADLAGVRLPTPPPHLRQRILDHRPGQPSSHRRGTLFRWWPALAAAVLLFAVIAPLLGPKDLPQGLEFELRAEGLASVRGEGAVTAGSEPIQAYPDTQVRVELEPVGDARSDLEVSLFRRSGIRLERLSVEAPLTLEVVRGRALLEGPAATLAGSSAGPIELFFVVHRRGDVPPETVELGGEDPVKVLARGHRRKVYPWQIQLRSAGSDE